MSWRARSPYIMPGRGQSGEQVVGGDGGNSQSRIKSDSDQLSLGISFLQGKKLVSSPISFLLNDDMILLDAIVYVVEDV